MRHPPFQPGNPGGGRPPGVRNRLSKAILEDLLADWKEHGAKAIKLMRIERPADYVRVQVSTLPKELVFEGSVTAALSDEELDGLIEQMRHMLAERKEPMLIEAKIAEPADER